MRLTPQILALLVLFAALLEPGSALAQWSIISSSVPNCDFVTGVIDAACVPSFLAHIMKFIFAIVGALALIMIIVSGYQIALAKAIGRDRSEGLTRLRVAIIGFVLCAFSWYIVDFIISALAGL